MGSRLFWILLTGVALVAGIAIKEGDMMFSWDHDSARDRAIEARIDSSVDRTVDRSIGRMEVIGSDGKEIEVSPETKRALGNAVAELVSAETQLALAKVRHADDADLTEATARRDAARTEVDRLKAEIERQERLSASDRDVMREQIRQKIRDDVRQSVRDAVRG